LKLSDNYSKQAVPAQIKWTPLAG